MLIMMLQFGFMLCLTPFLLLQQSEMHISQQQRVAQVGQLLLARHQALQQYCEAQNDASGKCGFAAAQDIDLATIQPYLDASLQASPYLQDGTGMVRSYFDGTRALSYVDPTRLAGSRGLPSLGQIQAQWLKDSAGSQCAGVLARGQLRCADGVLEAIAGGLPEGAPIIADP